MFFGSGAGSGCLFVVAAWAGGVQKQRSRKGCFRLPVKKV
jgi:hypothetical protein